MTDIQIIDLFYINYIIYIYIIEEIISFIVINPLYIDRTGIISYRVGNMSLSDEVNIFRNKYLSFIKKNNYMDYKSLYMNGIGIDRMDVYMNDIDMDFLNNTDLEFYVKQYFLVISVLCGILYQEVV